MSADPGDPQERSNTLLVQLIRYGLVGGVAFAADFAVLTALVELANVHYMQAAAMGFCVGLVVNYWASVRWVFERKEGMSRSVEMGGYAVVGVMGLGWNEAILWASTEWAGLHYIVSKLIATGCVFLWNFFVRKYLLFS